MAELSSLRACGWPRPGRGPWGPGKDRQAAHPAPAWSPRKQGDPGGEARSTASPPAMGPGKVSLQAALRLSGEAAGASSTLEVPPRALWALGTSQGRGAAQRCFVLQELRMFAREQGALVFSRAKHSSWPLLGNCSPVGRHQEAAPSPRAQPASCPEGQRGVCMQEHLSCPGGPRLSAAPRGQDAGRCREVFPSCSPWVASPMPRPQALESSV